MTRATDKMPGPLSSIRVADFSVHAAGPFASLMLAELGAQVIKVESAARLDITRRPHTMYGKPPSSFEQVNANKLSVCLNLKEPEAVALALELVRLSDVVLENFRPGVMERLGLGFDALRRVKPDIVLVSVSSNGQSGPERGYAGYAPMFAAVGGLGHLTGYPDGPPVELRHAMDHTGGMLGAYGAVLGLCAKSRFSARAGATGDGRASRPPANPVENSAAAPPAARHVDVSLRDLATAFIGPALMDYSMNGREAQRQGNGDDGLAPHGVYRCSGEDAWVSIAVSSEEEWQGLREAMGNPSWAREPRFGDGYQRWLHRDALDRLLEEWTAGLADWEVCQRLQERGVPAFPSLSAEELANDPHLLARDAFPTVRHTEKGSHRAVAPPWKFSRSKVQVDRWTPDLGEHNMEVFHGLMGLGPDRVRGLEEAKIIW